MPEIVTISLAAAEGPVTVEITIGHAQFGKYELALYDTEGRNPVVIGAGLSDDQEPDIFSMTQPPAALHGRFLSWSANLIPAGDEPNPLFSLTVRVRQQGAERPGSPVLVQGPLPQPRAEFGFARLEVV